MSDDVTALAKFGGVARVFPLPNLVLFPQVMQPLHIFEQRYRQMTAHALAGDRLLALALLRPGWEDDYEGRPAIHPVVCLGRIVADQRLEDGRYNLLLRGLKRVRVIEELETAFLYRSARVEVLDDVAVAAAAESDLRRRLIEQTPHWFSAQPQVLEQFRKLFDGGVPLDTLTDLVSFAVPMPVAFKQELLETLSVEERVKRLLARLEAHAPLSAGGEKRFPPGFSDN
jgi:uncharacterized protein